MKASKSAAPSLSLSLSRIPRYSQRLKSLFFKKTLSDRLDDVRPKIEAVHFSCKELKTSKKLRKVRRWGAERNDEG